jgi:hypothetical protein
MAMKKCQRCGEEKNTAAYIAVNSIVHGGSLPICRQCLANQISRAYKEENSWNVVDKICQWADVPFIPEYWEKMYAGHGQDAIGAYISTFRGQPYESLDWKMYNDAYLILQDEQRVEDALPQVRAAQRKKLEQKWGRNYDDEELEYLENLHQGLLSSQNIVGALNEDQALKLCKISLIIEQKIRADEDFDKTLKAYDQLSKLANLTPKVVKDAHEFNSWGEVMAYLEKKGFTCTYYDGAVRDEADFTAKDIKYWLQSLYVNETGIAEEIEQRIANLKLAAELTHSKFDEKEFRDYLQNEGLSKIDDDEFEPELG